jgi:hypothetical protein
MFFEFEIFWSHVGQSRFPGFSPHEYPWSMPERFPLFHVKDGIDFSGTGAAPPLHHYIVERDTAPDAAANPAGSFSTARRSHAYLAGLRERRH